MNPFNRLSVLLTLILFSGCGLSGTPSSCATGTAQMTVLDSGLQRGCGCAEASGSLSPSAKLSSARLGRVPG